MSHISSPESPGFMETGCKPKTGYGLVDAMCWMIMSNPLLSTPRNFVRALVEFTIFIQGPLPSCSGTWAPLSSKHLWSGRQMVQARRMYLLVEGLEPSRLEPGAVSCEVLLGGTSDWTLLRFDTTPESKSTVEERGAGSTMSGGASACWAQNLSAWSQLFVGRNSAEYPVSGGDCERRSEP